MISIWAPWNWWRQHERTAAFAMGLTKMIYVMVGLSQLLLLGFLCSLKIVMKVEDSKLSGAKFRFHSCTPLIQIPK